MSGFVPFVFTDTQLTDIRRFCGFPTQSNGQVLFTAQWVNVQYLALEVRLQTCSLAEGAVVVARLAELNAMEALIPQFAAQVNIGVAAVFTRNPQTMNEARRNFDDWRLRLWQFLLPDQPPGPGLINRNSNTIRLIV